MKIICFSDTHNKHARTELPACDLAIFAGDMSSVGHEREVETFLNWFYRQKQCVNKVYIAGNHDKSFDPKFFYTYNKNYESQYDQNTKPYWVNDLISNANILGIHYLENTSVEINGYKIWGSPYSPWFFGEYWAFNAHRNGDLDAIWSTIPDDTDIVITHTPVQGKLDSIPSQQDLHVGCEKLNNHLHRVKAKLHVCGHIHEGHGYEQDGGITYVNASQLDDRYMYVYSPIEVITDDQTKEVISVKKLR